MQNQLAIKHKNREAFTFRFLRLYCGSLVYCLKVSGTVGMAPFWVQT